MAHAKRNPAGKRARRPNRGYPRPRGELRPMPGEPTALVAVASYFLDALAIGVTLVDAPEAYAVHAVPSLVELELQHAHERQRYAHNQRGAEMARARRRPVALEYGGFVDFYAPIVRRGQPGAMLMAGPATTAPFTSTELHQRFFDLTGEHGTLSDPSFAYYVTRALETTRLEGSDLDAFLRYLGVVADAIAAERDGEELARAYSRAEADLFPATTPRRVAAETRSMLDPRTFRGWQSHYRDPGLLQLNLRRRPELVAVCLTSDEGRFDDPLDALLARHEFQRQCVWLALDFGNVVPSNVGDRGVAFLLAPERSRSRSEARLQMVVERASSVARRFRLRLHTGLALSHGRTLPERHDLGIAAAERALLDGVASVTVSRDEQRRARPLRVVRDELVALDAAALGHLPDKFEEYMRAVSLQAGYALAIARREFDFGLERLTARLRAQGSLDVASESELFAKLQRESDHAATLSDLMAGYRAAIADLVQGLERPSAGQRERNLQRAVAFIRDNATEKLTLAQAAHVAGFEPSYFSRLFHRREKVKFERYVLVLRIERAKQLLGRTSFGIERVAELSGFSSSAYFCRAFKRITGETPAQYRARPS